MTDGSQELTSGGEQFETGTESGSAMTFNVA
jgi:hypothetical protein